MEIKDISQLRTFFRVSNAIFNFKNEINFALNGIIIPNKMQYLHKMALKEIEKETPNLSIIKKLIEEMEKISEDNKSLK